VFHVQPEDGHYQAPKHVVLPYVENTLYSTNKYSSVRPIHTLYISYFIEHTWGDEPHEVLSDFHKSNKKCNKKLVRLVRYLTNFSMM